MAAETKKIISVSGTYHETIGLYTKKFLVLVGVALVPNLITYLLMLSLRASVVANIARLESVVDFFSITNTSMYVAVFIIITIFVVYMLGAIALAWAVVHHEKSTILAAFENSLNFFWRFVWMGIILALVTLAGMLIGYLLLALLGVVLGNFSIDLLNSSLAWLTLIPLLVTSVLAAFFLFTPYVILEQDASVTKALQRSFRMVRAHFWGTAFRVVLFNIFMYAVLYVVNLVPRIGDLISLVIVAPFAVVYLFVLYRNLNALTPQK